MSTEFQWSHDMWIQSWESTSTFFENTNDQEILLYYFTPITFLYSPIFILKLMKWPAIVLFLFSSLLIKNKECW